MPWGAIASAAIGAGASLLGSKKQNEAAASAAANQMAFQRESAQNQYRWAMADMEAAGLNPMLAYSQGGTGTLSGATYAPVNELSGVGEGVNSAFANMQRELSLDKTEAEIKNLFWEGQLKQSSTYKADQEAANLRKTHDLINEEIKKRKYEVTTAKTAATVAREDDKFYKTDVGKFMRWLDRAGSSLNPFTSATGVKVK